MPSQAEIFDKVSAVLIEALNVEQEDIKPTATLQWVDGLGAEDIDLLDIVFRLEREFGIKIPRNDLFPAFIFQGDLDYVEEGRITEKGLNELRAKAWFDLTAFERNPRLEFASGLFTVEMLVKYIEYKLNPK